MPPAIFILDSGLGGLPYLERIRLSLPRAQYIYLADRACFPYGNKSSGFLKARLAAVSRALCRLHHPSVMVIACNSASVSTLDCLREQFAFPIVGVVPAVKPASLIDGGIMVLATDHTVRGSI